MLKTVCAALALLAVTAVAPGGSTPAAARVYVALGVPAYYPPPPVYYAPPVVYAAPPAVYPYPYAYRYRDAYPYRGPVRHYRHVVYHPRHSCWCR